MDTVTVQKLDGTGSATVLVSRPSLRLRTRALLHSPERPPWGSVQGTFLLTRASALDHDLGKHRLLGSKVFLDRRPVLSARFVPRPPPGS